MTEVHNLARQVLAAGSSPYAVLLLPEYADFAEVRAAYKRLLNLHPDKTGGDERCCEAFKAITNAFDRIKEAHNRRGAGSGAGDNAVVPLPSKWSSFANAPRGDSPAAAPPQTTAAVPVASSAAGRWGPAPAAAQLERLLKVPAQQLADGGQALKRYSGGGALKAPTTTSGYRAGRGGNGRRGSGDNPGMTRSSGEMGQRSVVEAAEPAQYVYHDGDALAWEAEQSMPPARSLMQDTVPTGRLSHAGGAASAWHRQGRSSLGRLLRQPLPPPVEDSSRAQPGKRPGKGRPASGKRAKRRTAKLDDWSSSDASEEDMQGDAHRDSGDTNGNSTVSSCCRSFQGTYMSFFNAGTESDWTSSSTSSASGSDDGALRQATEGGSCSKPASALQHLQAVVRRQKQVALQAARSTGADAVTQRRTLAVQRTAGRCQKQQGRRPAAPKRQAKLVLVPSIAD